MDSRLTDFGDYCGKTTNNHVLRTANSVFLNSLFVCLTAIKNK